MNLEQLKEEWAKDCEVDDIELDKSSLEKDDLYLPIISEIFLFLSSIILIHKR